MAQITGGEAVIRALKAAGVEVVFGIPGVHVLPIYDALHNHPEIRHISARHEQAVAYMADGYARVTGKPGVCIATTGPGAANTAAAMGTAYSSSIPILNIMSQIATHLVDKGKGALHEAKDQLGMFKACTRWNTRVSTPDDISTAIREAFQYMKTEHPGPTAVELCTDILANQVDVERYRLEEEVEYQRSIANVAAVKTAAEMLWTATSPVIWVGGGAVRSGATDEVRLLADLLQAPVVTTIGGKGIIPEDHPLVIGTRSGEGSVRQLLAEADVVLAVGTRFSYNSTDNWTISLPQKLIHVDIDEGQIGKNYPASVGLVGDAKAVTSQILDALGGYSAGRSRQNGRVSEIVRQSFDTLHTLGPSEMQVIDEIRNSLPRDAIVVSDMTKLAFWIPRAFPVYEPGSLILPMGYATLGCGFPMALGAKVGAPKKKVVAIVGDGGFQFSLQDLATAVQFGINVTVLVFNDNCWGVLRDMQDYSFGGRRYMVDLHNPDFVKLAEAYGAVGLRVNGPGEFRSVLEQALSLDRVTVVDVPLEFAQSWMDIYSYRQLTATNSPV